LKIQKQKSPEPKAVEPVVEEKKVEEEPKPDVVEATAPTGPRPKVLVVDDQVFNC
jgi:hypothetical protein